MVCHVFYSRWRVPWREKIGRTHSSECNRKGVKNPMVSWPLDFRDLNTGRWNTAIRGSGLIRLSGKKVDSMQGIFSYWVTFSGRKKQSWMLWMVVMIDTHTVFAENQNLFPRRVPLFIAKRGGRRFVWYSTFYQGIWEQGKASYVLKKALIPKKAQKMRRNIST